MDNIQIYSKFNKYNNKLNDIYNSNNNFFNILLEKFLPSSISSSFHINYSNYSLMHSLTFSYIDIIKECQNNNNYNNYNAKDKEKHIYFD